MTFNSLKTPGLYAISISFLTKVLLLFIISAAKYFTEYELNTCDMTYMFEYPQYVRIRLKNKGNGASEDDSFPRFQLYAYGEGFVTERLRRMHFSGIPVLFIPGNAGSHEQVRSLASVSLRKSLKSRTPFHFDYFTVSFGKDYSAFYGGILQEETNFVAKCIQTIISLYQGKAKKIILIGHSMGGIIAKGALLLKPKINSNVASILITLAAPHKPAVFPDYTFLNYYEEIEKSMFYLKKNGTTVISIGGGSRDITVTSFQTIDEYADLNVLSTSMPGVWRSTDHLCILWCKQLVLNIVRSLFDCVDTSKKSVGIFESHEQRMKSFNWHFSQRFSFEKSLSHTKYLETVQFPSENSDWINNIPAQYVWNSKNYISVKSKKPMTVYLMIKIEKNIDTVSINAVHLKIKDWIFACPANQIAQLQKCSWGWNLSNRTKIIPGISRKPKKYSIDLDLQEITNLGASHVVIRIPNQNLNRDDDDEDSDHDDDNQIVQIDAYKRSERQMLVSNMNSWSSESGKLRYNIQLDGIFDVISVDFLNSNCTDYSYSHYSMIELIEPWASGSEQYYFFVENDNIPKIIKLQSVHLQQLHLMKSQFAEIQMSLDPACSHSVRIVRAGIIERIACMVRDRYTLIYPVTMALLLLALSQRIDYQNQDKSSVSLMILITGVLCVSLNITVECCVCIAMLHIMALGVCCSVMCFGSIAHNIAVRFLARVITFSTIWSDWLLGGLINQLPIVTTGILLSIVTATCGALAMLLSIFVQFLRLTQVYEDYLEELFWALLRYLNFLKKKDPNNNDSESIRDNILNQIVLFLVWCFAALPAVPSALVWAKNFSFSTRLLTEDKVFFWSWIIMVACGTSGLVKIPTTKRNSNKSKLLSIFVRLLGWIMISISATANVAYYYWCIPPIMAFVVVLISINSLYG